MPEAELTEEAAGGWRAWLGAWRAKLAEEGVPDAERWAAMKAANPKFIPRQHLLQVRVGGGGPVGRGPRCYEPRASACAGARRAPRGPPRQDSPPL
jgi:hypothetical protein